ncbi:hypothetical protein DAPPUDRAFT_261807 [Daphnia pulex]|uniref:Chromo domain-containing protein n=1 Tax=Daphnia pulex TaxID=6669 RepID=E9HLQ2_DAPPU|nr:hypothetical protein DAPPUDRAFT_261807 [Daphnia pulex]|eukprot:EFX67326.1 hypothetical protein DAPPUDRAFT_261807 [Daphnia pulex]
MLTRGAELRSRGAPITKQHLIRLTKQRLIRLTYPPPILRKKTRYLIKWKGYPHVENTWEPYSHLREFCYEAVKEFRERKMGGKFKNLTDAGVQNQRTSTHSPEVVIDIAPSMKMLV